MKKARSLRGLMTAFALAVMAPLLLALAIFLWRTAEASRADVEQNILQAAGDLAADIDWGIATSNHTIAWRNVHQPCAVNAVGLQLGPEADLAVRAFGTSAKCH